MATKKKMVKPVSKKTAKPVKKSAPAKPSRSTAGKTVSKKAVAKKPIAKVSKSTSKKPTKVVKPVAKASTKKTTIPVKKISKQAASPKKPVTKISVPKKGEIKKTVKLQEEKKSPVKVSAPVKAKDIKIIPAKPVSLPKITTKTSRKYQPDFTKSVLDKPAHNAGAPIVRYSDVELNEFRELIQRKLESAKKELSYLQGLITRKDEMGGDNDDARYMTMEDGSMSMEREQLSQMASRQITFIDHLEKAIMRIENKTYGICRITGRLIDKARLRAVPHATLSIEAKMGAAK